MTDRGPQLHQAGYAGWLPWVMIGLTVGVFGGAICLVSEHLRQKIRKQIADRDGDVLYSVALMQQHHEDLASQLLGPIEDPATQFDIILKTSRLKGVLAARLFDARGYFVAAFPAEVAESALARRDVLHLLELKPVSHFCSKADLRRIYLEFPSGSGAGSASAPLLEVNIPLHLSGQRQLHGIAQFILSGENIAAQFAALDRHLIRQAGLIFLIGGVLIASGLFRAFRRLQRANRLLEERTQALTRAHQELVLASKTSAVGAVAAHLIHGLKNPLFGLKNLVNQCVQEPSSGSDTEWKTAAESTEQMHAIINEIVRLLRDDESLVESYVSLADLAEVIRSRGEKLASEAGIRFHTSLTVEGTLSHRAANLVLLILHNLIQNALQASAPGQRVQLVLTADGRDLLCEVHDQGPGLPAEVQKSLFLPCRSTKPNSSGIGLAISKQLANHLGATLRLKKSDAQGSIFCLRLPERMLLESPAAFAA